MASAVLSYLFITLDGPGLFFCLMKHGDKYATGVLAIEYEKV